MQKVLAVIFFIAVMLFLLGGCEKITDPATVTDNPILEKKGDKGTGTIPDPLFTVENVEFWPHTGSDFSGTPSDPMNLFFYGEADPLAIRAALLFLDGNRTVYCFPDVPPFNSTWKDAIGGVQTSYASASGWIGSAIQLEEGDYQGMRFHLRLFDAGEVTLGAAHLDLWIPNTTEHQVISWEVPEQLVMADLLRSGLAELSDPAVINPEPSFREIPSYIWEVMPPELQYLVGGIPGSTGNFPVPCDVNAQVFHMTGGIAGSPQIATQDFVIDFNQIIPKPFCNTPYDYLLVQGPVHMRQKVVFTPLGNFISQFHANGHLNLTPVDPMTGNPIGDTYQAVINEHHKGIITNNVTLVSGFQMQVMIPPSGPFNGQLLVHLNVGPGNSSDYSLEYKCDNP
ncbi:MAG: hypothetical protein A2Y94_14830 [Caldithrix sp. RBG_13_44_9]|nr:MAG: hypothetical protein A2Y94_14830 [Caldithrix sp. RBG_13_44_9]